MKRFVGSFKTIALSLPAAVMFAACSGSIKSGEDKPNNPDKPGTGGDGTVDPVKESSQAAGPIAMRRLTASQYRNVIADVFGTDVTIPALELEPATEGYTSVGASRIGTSRVGVERYEAAATTVAAQVFQSASKRTRLASCTPSGVDDSECAKQFLGHLGRMLYRRPLSEAESERLVSMGLSLAQENKDFWKGMEWATAALLQSPKFLYRSEMGTEINSVQRFTDFDLASRLSFFLWNAGPDKELMDAAERGQLNTTQGLREETKRLLSSDKAQRGFRTFFQEFMRFDDDAVAKDVAGTLPISESLYMATREQTMRTLEKAFFEDGADISEVLRSPVTYLNRELAQHYGVDAPSGEGFSQVRLSGDGGRTGILGHASFLIKMSNQPDSAPTARGKFVREALLCQGVPPPPDGVSTELEEVPTDRPITMRERLEIHRTNPACASCHAMTDPIGLGLENFDSLGRFREKEHGLTIDPSGDLDGVAFEDAQGLAEAVSKHPALAGCFVRQIYRYATGQAEPEEALLLDDLAKRYVGKGKPLADLLSEFVTTNVFLTASHSQ